MQRPSNTKLNERGFASIVIALIFIIVLALLTVGFAQLARREQQTALDKQKAIQANYAAESGYNAAYKDITSNKDANGCPYIYDGSFEKDNSGNPCGSGGTNASSTTCMTGDNATSGTRTLKNGAFTYNQDINQPNGVSYSCLLVQLTTPDISGDGLSPGSDRHLNFSTSDSLTSLTIHWGSDTGRHTFAPSLDPNNPQLPALGNWSYPPVMEFNITPTSGLPAALPSGNPDQYLRDNTFTFYVYPSSSGSNTINYSTDPNQQGQVVSGACNIPAAGVSDPNRSSKYPCVVQLNGLNGQQFVMHYTSFYDTATFQAYPTSIGGDDGSGPSFFGEPVIDVTGKARDVLKRLRVRLFVNGGASNTPDDNAILPNGAVEAQNICKRIQAAPSTTDFPAGSTYDTGTSPACDLSN